MNIILALFIFLAALPAFAAECDEDRKNFATQKSDLQQSLGDYSSCISSNTGDGDCDTEFSRVNSDQNDFDAAVKSIDSDDCKVENND